MAQDSRHVCPKISFGMLPFVIQDAAEKGNTHEVINWLDNGGDINASNMARETLVYTACVHDNVELLEELVKRPDVHLNHTVKDEEQSWRVALNSPLKIACDKGNVDCVEVLLNSNSKCIEDLIPILEADCVQKLCQHEQWDCVTSILRRKPHFNNTELTNFLRDAIKNQVIPAIKEILLLFTDDFAVDVNLLIEIYKRGFWNKVNAEAVLKKHIANNDFMTKILRLITERKDWNRLEPLLQVLVSDVKINKKLSCAILDRKSDEVKTMLSEGKNKAAELNAAVFVAAIGGTSEEIVKMLFDPSCVGSHEYSSEVTSNALIFSLQNHVFEFLPVLFKKYTFSYPVLCRAEKVANHSNKRKRNEEQSAEVSLIKRARSKVEDEIMPAEGTSKDDKK